MPQQYYSVEQVAELLGLHVRTVRGYARDGRLRATRIGKQYRIAREALEAFTAGTAADGVTPAAVAAADPTPAPAAGATGAARSHAEASSIVQLDGIDRPAASRLINTVMALLTGPPQGGERLHVETVYDEERQVLKVIVLGGLVGTAELLKIIAALAENIG
ncbi:helix-turn-helix domain-containing protein [Kitasatospora nipponensis]|uniref:Helix-turn-helix domain-containing protein n=1 Tax=Kitasatospora nipponensis TaxID=258049 RepID=A0ABP4GEF9_9ACTN